LAKHGILEPCPAFFAASSFLNPADLFKGAAQMTGVFDASGPILRLDSSSVLSRLSSVFPLAVTFWPRRSLEISELAHQFVET
jgi:hypothetical protein